MQMLVNPYEAPVRDELPAYGERGRLQACLWTIITTFGASMAVLSLFGSTVWDGSLKIYDIKDQFYVYTASISLALAILSGTCLYFSLTLTQPHLRVTLLAMVAAVGIGTLIFVEWPVAIYFSYFDLSNLLAGYVAIGVLPTLMIALAPLRLRKWWYAVIPYAIILIIVIYVLIRPS